ncbi:MAG: hypothetical protein OEV66_08235 [Spirochaetia bacterium]|nr:hypothetical protein [Spirochaetia bacterium]
MKRLNRILVCSIFIWVYYPAQAEDALDTKVKGLLTKHCNLPQQESMQPTFGAIIKRMPLSTFEDAIRVLDLTLPQICFFDYPGWLIDRAFNLAVYGFHEGDLQPATVKKMSEFMRSISLGKQDYIAYGRILENLLSSGVAKEYINDFIHTSINENYGTAGAEALAHYYAIKAAETKNHEESLKFALDETKVCKSQYDRFYVLNKLYGETDETAPKYVKASEQEKMQKEFEEKNLEFWKKYRNKIRLSEKLAIKKTAYTDADIVKILNDRLKTQYGYRMNKSFGLDATGLVSLISRSPIDSLPYDLDTYCSSNTIGSVGSLKTGDVVLFSASTSDREISALGVYTENSEFVYVSVAGGLIQANLKDSYYKNRFIKGCRILH